MKITKKSHVKVRVAKYYSLFGTIFFCWYYDNILNLFHEFEYFKVNLTNMILSFKLIIITL